jgi:hypothetical protein
MWGFMTSVEEDEVEWMWEERREKREKREERRERERRERELLLFAICNELFVVFLVVQM